jgi:hypothetical protein
MENHPPKSPEKNLRKIITGTVAVLALFSGSSHAESIKLLPTPCIGTQQFACEKIGNATKNDIRIDATNGPAVSSSNGLQTYQPTLKITIDGTVYSGTATAVGGALTGHTVDYKYSGKNIAREDGQAGMVDLDKVVLGLTGVSCGRGKVCFTGSGVHTNVAGGTLVRH